MATRLANPYVVGTPLSGEQPFYGREDIFQFVRDTFSVASQNVVVLYGQRRIGKTSLLHKLVVRMSHDHHAVLFDLQGKGQHDLADLLADLSATLARSLKLPAPDPSLFAADRDPFREVVLPEVYAAIGDKRLLILFDEFDVIGDEPSSSDDLAGEHFFHYLHNLISTETRLAFVFVIGRRVDELPVHYRSFFKQAVFRRLSVLQRQEAVDLIVQPVIGALDYAPDAIDAILDLTAGHPYLTQLLCHVVYKRQSSAGRRSVTVGDVTACLDEAMELGTGGLDWFWEGLPRAERIMLSALAETLQSRSGASNGAGQSLSATEDDILHALNRHRVRLLGVELTGARQRLLEWEIVTRDDDRYRFAIDLVRRWIARVHPLDRAQQDIDLISQRASRYFNNARDAHLAGDLTLAIEDYRRALSANPNHFGARLGLAQSLQESTDLPGAIAEYELAYSIDPASARDGLVSARLALGSAHQRRGELDAAANEFEQILRVAPSDDEAQGRLIAIWIQRGEAHLSAGDYTAAINAFASGLAISPEEPALRTRVKTIVRRFSEASEARGAWDAAFKSVALLAEYLSADEQMHTWLAETRSKWRAQSYFELAERARAAGDQITTIEECRRALDSNPNHAQARLLLATMLYEIGDLSKAIDEYEKAHHLNPPAAAQGLAQARLQRAVLLESQDDLAGAVADYERVLEVQPTSDTPRRRLPTIYMRRGEEHLATGHLDDAVVVLRKALLTAPQPQTLARPIKAKFAEYSQAQRLAGNWDAAIAAIGKLRSDLMLRDRESDGWMVDLWLQRAKLTLEQRRYREAASVFKQTLHAVADMSDSAPVIARVKSDFFLHAESRLKADQPDDAIAAVNALVEALGADAETFSALANAWLARGDLDFKHDRLNDAEHAFQRALELQPNSQEALARLTALSGRRTRLDTDRLRAEAAAQAARKDWIEAEKLYRRLVVDLRDEVSRPLFVAAAEEIRLEELYKLARSYHVQGEWEAAIPVWIDICHSRGDYVGRDGQKAAILLADAIRRRDGVAQAGERTMAMLKRRVRLAWIAAAVLGVLAVGQFIYALANGLL